MITAGIAASSSTFADYLAREFRCASLWSRLMANEFSAMQVALRAGFIDPDSALEHLHEVGALDLIGVST